MAWQLVDQSLFCFFEKSEKNLIPVGVNLMDIRLIALKCVSFLYGFAQKHNMLGACSDALDKNLRQTKT